MVRFGAEDLSRIADERSYLTPAGLNLLVGAGSYQWEAQDGFEANRVWVARSDLGAAFEKVKILSFCLAKFNVVLSSF